jgi:polyisoprenoid-binding protein YceI
MNIPSLVSSIAFLSLVNVSPVLAESAKSLPLALDQSVVKWTGGKKLVDDKHHGTLKLKSGEIQLAGTELRGGKFDIDMASLENQDIESEKNRNKLVNHLKSDDFFDVAKFPVSTFKITKVVPTQKEGATHLITGDLTIKGVTHPVTFPATVTIEKDAARAKAKFPVDRTKWNVRYGSGKFFKGLGDKVIKDEFEVDLDLVAKT